MDGDRATNCQVRIGRLTRSTFGSLSGAMLSTTHVVASPRVVCSLGDDAALDVSPVAWLASDTQLPASFSLRAHITAEEDGEEVECTLDVTANTRQKRESRVDDLSFRARDGEPILLDGLFKPEDFASPQLPHPRMLLVITFNFLK